MFVYNYVSGGQRVPWVGVIRTQIADQPGCLGSWICRQSLIVRLDSPLKVINASELRHRREQAPCGPCGSFDGGEEDAPAMQTRCARRCCPRRAGRSDDPMTDTDTLSAPCTRSLGERIRHGLIGEGSGKSLRPTSLGKASRRMPIGENSVSVLCVFDFRLSHRCLQALLSRTHLPSLIVDPSRL